MGFGHGHVVGRELPRLLPASARKTDDTVALDRLIGGNLTTPAQLARQQVQKI